MRFLSYGLRLSSPDAAEVTLVLRRLHQNLPVKRHAYFYGL